MAIKPRELKGGKTAYWISFYDQNKKQRWEHGGFDERKAQSLEKQRRREVKAGTYQREIKGRVTVASWFDEYWKTRKNRTLKNDKALIRDHVLSVEWFASMALEDVRRRHSLRVVEEMRKAGRLNEKSIATVWGVARGAFRHALFEERVSYDVSELPKGTLRRKTAKADRRVPYTREEVGDLITRAERADVRVWLCIAFFTGMRKGEVCGRRWKDWDRNAKPLTSLHVHSQYNDQPLKGDDDEKTRPRLVPVHPWLEEILAEWWDHGFEVVHQRRPTPDDFIVPTESGKNHSRGSIYRAFQRAREQAGVQNRTVHSTRHTFTSVARQCGARPDVLERVTHNASGQLMDPMGTIDDYTTFDWATLCKAVEVLDFCLDSKNGGASDPPDDGSRAWTRSRDTTGQPGETRGNGGKPDKTRSSGKHAGSSKSDAGLDAGQENLPQPVRDAVGKTRRHTDARIVANGISRAYPRILAGDPAGVVKALKAGSKALEKLPKHSGPGFAALKRLSGGAR